MAACTGQTTHLFLKPHHRSPMQSVSQLVLKVGHGIIDDINAIPISPRQILLVRQEDLNDLSIPPSELRENIVLSGLPAETFRPGALIQFQRGPTIRLTFYCEPCKRIGHLVKSGQSIVGKRGILGVVIAAGEIYHHENVQVHPAAFPALPEKPFERFLGFLAKVPSGQVITYKHIIQGIGVANGYYRALPKYLQKAAQLGYPVHRVLDSAGCLSSHMPDQAKLLSAEGIAVVRGITPLGDRHPAAVNLERHLWYDNCLYQR